MGYFPQISPTRLSRDCIVSIKNLASSARPHLLDHLSNIVFDRYLKLFWESPRVLTAADELVLFVVIANITTFPRCWWDGNRLHWMSVMLKYNTAAWYWRFISLHLQRENILSIIKFNQRSYPQQSSTPLGHTDSVRVVSSIIPLL